jgi:hypothetical protein
MLFSLFLLYKLVERLFVLFFIYLKLQEMTNFFAIWGIQRDMILNEKRLMK